MHFRSLSALSSSCYEVVSFYVSSYRHCYTANPSNQSNFGLIGCAGIQVDLNLDKWTCIIFTWVNVFKVFRVFLLLSNLNVFSGLNVFYSPKFFCLQSSTVVTNQSWISNSKFLQWILLQTFRSYSPFHINYVWLSFLNFLNGPWVVWWVVRVVTHDAHIIKSRFHILICGILLYCSQSISARKIISPRWTPYC